MGEPRTRRVQGERAAEALPAKAVSRSEIRKEEEVVGQLIETPRAGEIREYKMLIGR
jgi:hypothetical protein